MRMIEVQFIGSGDAFGSGGRLQTCLLVRGADAPLLIDCGASSLIGMNRLGIDPSTIASIVLTHLHGDHFAGVPFLILDGQFSRRSTPLLIAGPQGTQERVERAMEVLFPGSTTVPRRFRVDYLELADGGTITVGPARVTAFQVEHFSGAPPFAVRVEYGDKIVGYSGDTQWTDALIRAAEGADLFIAEAYFFDKQIKYHLDYRTLQAHRSALGCRRLILTHLSADMLGHLTEVDAECAEDGLTVRL